MKKQGLLLLAVLVTLAMALQGSAFAETIQGKVKSVDAQANSLRIQKIEAKGGAEQGQAVKAGSEQGGEELDISISSAAKFQGASSLADIKVGDTIKAEVSGQGYGPKTAESIQRL